MTAPTSAAEVRAILPQIQWFDDAYARANKTSNPEDWLDAACSGQQLRNAVIEFLGPRLLGQQGGDAGEAVAPTTVADFRAALKSAKETLAFLNALPLATHPSPVQAGSAAPADGGEESEQAQDDRLLREDAADNLRLIDSIADLIGVPHNEELTIGHVRARLAAVQAERDQAVAVLRQLEWSDTVQDTITDAISKGCPLCHVSVLTGYHHSGCTLAATLASSTSVGTGEAPDA